MKKFSADVFPFYMAGGVIGIVIAKTFLFHAPTLILVLLLIGSLFLLRKILK